MTRNLLAIIVASILIISKCAAQSPISVSVTSGDGVLDEESISVLFVNGKWNISFTAAGGPYGGAPLFVGVFAHQPISIRYIHVESNRYNDNPSSMVQVTCLLSLSHSE